MRNIKATMKNDQLTLVIDLKQELGASKTGKNILVASSGGNQSVEGTEFKLGLNLFKAPKAA